MAKSHVRDIVLPVQTACELQALLERIDLVLRPIMDQLPGSEVTDIWPPRAPDTELVGEYVTQGETTYNTLGTFPACNHPMAKLGIEVLFQDGRRAPTNYDDSIRRALYDMNTKALRAMGVVGWRYV